MITRGPAPAADGDVLVGVDGSAADDAPLGFAFREAALRGADLRALHAWNRPGLTNPELLLRYDAGPEDTAHAEVLTEAALSWSRKYLTVTMHRELTTDRPENALSAERKHSA
jgi:hypothetical protein